jgi:hypothetical protein
LGGAIWGIPDERSDTTKAFINALEHKDYVLPAGDRRGFVVVDEFANIHSLTRYVNLHGLDSARR